MHKIESQMPPFDRSISPCRDVHLDDDSVQKQKQQQQQPASPVSSTTSKTSSTSSSSFLSLTSSSSSEGQLQNQLQNVNINNNNNLRNTLLIKKNGFHVNSSVTKGETSSLSTSTSTTSKKVTIKIGGFLATTSRRLAIAASTRIQVHVEHYREYKQIVSTLELCFYNLIDLLQRKGVTNGCIVLLRKQIKNASSSSTSSTSTTNTNNSNNNNHSNTSTSPNSSTSSSSISPSNGNSTNSSVILVYVQILQQCQQYAELLVANNMTSTTTSNTVSAISVTHLIDIESMNQMIISCWSQLYVFASYQYKQAYKSYNTIRDKITERKQAIIRNNNNNNNTAAAGAGGTSTCNPILTCSDDFVGSEYNTVTPQSLLLSESQHQQQAHAQTSTTSTLNNFLQYPLHIQIERASRYQNQLAEECCSVQKYLLLAQSYERKQRYQLQKLRKIQSQQQSQEQTHQHVINNGQ